MDEADDDDVDVDADSEESSKAGSLSSKEVSKDDAVDDAEMFIRRSISIALRRISLFCAAVLSALERDESAAWRSSAAADGKLASSARYSLSSSPRPS